MREGETTTLTARSEPPPPSWPVHGGEMAALVRAHDWAATPLGPVEGWSSRLKLMVEVVLANPLVSSLVCGPERVLIYNDAAARLYGARHPAALGRPLPETFPEGWAIVAPLYARAFAGEVVQVTAQPLDTCGEGEGGVDAFDATLVPVRDDAGLVASVYMTGQEVGPRLRAETALRESEARFQHVAHATRDIMWDIDLVADRVWWSGAMGRQLGYAPETIGPDTAWCFAHIHPDDRERVVGGMRQAIAGTGEHWSDEFRYERADGTYARIADRGFILRDAQGRAVRMIGAMQDLSARHEALDALRESEARFRGFAENSADVLWIVDAEAMRLEYLSPAFEAMWGEDRERVMADLGRWLELVHPDDRALAAQVLPRVGAGEVCTLEYRIVRPSDGDVRWVRDTGFPIRDAQGRVRRVGGVSQDVTDQQRAEQRIAASERHLRALVEGIPHLVWRAVGGGLWTWSSPQWSAFTGQAEAASRDLGWLEALHPDDRERAVAAWRAAESSGVFEVEYRVRHAGNGCHCWFQTRAVPLRDERGRVLEWLGTSTDIEDQVRAREVLARGRDELEALVEARTAELRRAVDALHAEALAREQAEERLRQSQKMEAVGQLTGGIAHDFNNMLQGIAGNLELMRRRAEQGRAAEAARYVESARKAVQRAAALTHRLLAFARQLPLDPAPVNLDRLAAGMEELIRRTVGPAIRVELRLGNGSWPVLCDENQLESALLNLCVNARDAMAQPSPAGNTREAGARADGGWLTISTGEVHLSAADLAGERDLSPGAYATIAVTDTGVGMDAEVMAHVFEPFFTTKPLGQGTGLGLSQIYGFVRQSGGLVRLESAPGRGTTVRLYLPRHEPAPAADDSAEAAAADVVLLVEDEDELREIVAEWLRETGYRVLEAPDGAAALRLLHGGGRVDVLVTDVGLPGGLNGRQVAEAVREHRPGLPVLFTTGYAWSLLGNVLPPGMEVIDKPFDLVLLAERVAAMLEAARSPTGTDRPPAGRPAQ